MFPTRDSSNGIADIDIITLPIEYNTDRLAIVLTMYV